jgi:uncharacterized Tic20 family protein
MTKTNIRMVGLWSSVATFLALALTVVTNNQNLGFGHRITRRNQLGLVAAAMTLCVLQLVLYLMARRKENNGKRDKRP